jgi:hypothetical protein
MKRLILEGITKLIDCIFPPLCLECEEMATDPFFCKNCWAFYSPIDPQFRCQHCFAALEEDTFLCLDCKQGSKFPIPRAFVFEKHSSIVRLWNRKEEYREAFGAFLFIQWSKLQWPPCDLVVILPEMRGVGAVFAGLMGKPYISITQNAEGDWSYPIDAIEEGQVLLFLDEGMHQENLYEALSFLSATSPKRGYSLSLMYDLFIHDPSSSSSPSFSCLSRH